MGPATKHLPKKCPRCDSLCVDVITDEGPTTRSATARYACGSVYLAFHSRWQDPFCVTLCAEEPELDQAAPVAEKDRDDVPEDFGKELLTKADLAHSFARLRGCRHFHAETMRGRIRSLQLRVDEAWRHFERAQELSDRAPDTIPNLIRVFNLNFFLFEHMLLERPVKSQAPLVQAEAPEPPSEGAFVAVLSRYPELAAVLRRKLAADGLMLFHAGAFDLAAARFEELIRTETLNDALAWYYVGLAACQENRGRHDLARRSIENAGLATQAAIYTLTRARAAGVLFGFHKYLGEDTEADDWEDFLWRLRCPEATKKVFLERGEWIEKRSARESRFVLL